MKNNHGLVWSEEHSDKSITIGFTKRAIEEKLAETFHVMQADATTLREKGPMLVLETNDGLESIKSPFTGRITYFNSKARNFPDKLTEEDTVLTIRPAGAKVAKEIPAYEMYAGVGAWANERVELPTLEEIRQGFIADRERGAAIVAAIRRQEDVNINAPQGFGPVEEAAIVDFNRRRRAELEAMEAARRNPIVGATVPPAVETPNQRAERMNREARARRAARRGTI